MSKSIKAIIALGFVAVVAACGGSSNEEEVVIIEPVQQEPVYNKY
jgi:hypothetical protein